MKLSSVINWDRIVDMKRTMFGYSSASVYRFAQVWFEPIAHQFTKVTLSLEFLIVNFVAEYSRRDVRAVLDGALLICSII